MTVLLTGVALGVAFLFAFYHAVQVRWPESYFGASEVSAYAISASPVRYIVFRFTPVYVTAVFVAVSVDRAGGRGGLAAILVGTLHSVLTTGRALAEWVPSKGAARAAYRAITLIRAATLIVVVGVAFAATATYRWFSPLVPPVSELASTLWTALLAGVVGAFIVQSSRRDAPTDSSLVERSLIEIPAELSDYARDAATEADIDPALVLAVMAVENLQRPKWFRKLERAKGAVFGRGTYGIMQVVADRPLSDKESIDRALVRFANVDVASEYGGPDEDKLNAFAAAYNRGSKFAELLGMAYVSASSADA